MKRVLDIETPPPKSVNSSLPTCRHPKQVALVERLDRLGIEEFVYAARRRDRLGMILGAVAISLVCALGAWIYQGSLHSARVEEQLRARVTQLEQTANSRAGVTQELARLSASVDALNLRLADRLQAIDRRLARIESGPQVAVRRRRP